MEGRGGDGEDEEAKGWEKREKGDGRERAREEWEEEGWGGEGAGSALQAKACRPPPNYFPVTIDVDDGGDYYGNNDKNNNNNTFFLCISL